VPLALADLELAELGRRELGDQRREELIGQARDARVVGQTALVGGGLRWAFALAACVGQRSDLLVGRRLVAP
jgi:hypothetical protein